MQSKYLQACFLYIAISQERNGFQMKNKRHEKILEIVKTKEIATQGDLVNELQRHGFEVTQATISRDIKELRLIKLQTENTYKYAFGIPSNGRGRIIPKYTSIIKETIVKIDHVGNIVVVICHSGMANAAAEAIDVSEMPGVVGTVAGDNTFIAIMRSEEDSIAFNEELRGVIDG